MTARATGEAPHAGGSAARVSGDGLREAVERYHELLAGDDALAQETQAQLDEQLRRRHLDFGGRLLCTVLRPRLTTPTRYRHLERRVTPLMRAFRRAYEAAIADADFRRQFRLADWEEQLVGVDPGYAGASPTSRLDLFVVDETDEMALTEYNAETPAGAGYNDVLADVFVDLPVMREFERRYHLRPVRARHGVFHVLMDAYAQWSGKRTGLRPRIAIIDWPEVPTRSEFLIFQEYFQSLGIECVIADPTDAEYRNGELVLGGTRVDLLYKRVLIAELVERCGLDSPVVRAVRDGKACMVNTFRSKILHKKASLAVLSDERNQHMFDGEAREMIRAHIPWTRVVEERRTEHDGKPVDLLPFIAREREQMVLKPNDDYGGAGIVLGWTVSDEEWERAIQRAVAAPYIVQQRVTIPQEPYPSLVDGRVQIYDRMSDTAPFICYGEFQEGVLTRLSTAALLNVTAGGGSTVPTFVVEER